MHPRTSLPSIAAILALLLAPLSGVAADLQAQVADLVRALGYGNAIHQFKNYVLRGADKHANAAAAAFAQAQETVTALQAGADAAQAEALKGIAGTIAQYQEALPTIKALQAEGKSVQEVDAAVKIDDKPAIEGLAALRGK
jgi:methyl-accepting chemotaxis protein